MSWLWAILGFVVIPLVAGSLIHAGEAGDDRELDVSMGVDDGTEEDAPPPEPVPDPPGGP